MACFSLAKALECFCLVEGQTLRPLLKNVQSRISLCSESHATCQSGIKLHHSLDRIGSMAQVQTARSNALQGCVGDLATA